jgi:transposase
LSPAIDTAQREEVFESQWNCFGSITQVRVDPKGQELPHAPSLSHTDGEQEVGMIVCPLCGATHCWILGDGRKKCQRCGARYSATSVWDSVRLNAEDKHQLLESFAAGKSAYQAHFAGGPCVDSTERFYRLIRACCLLNAPIDLNAITMPRVPFTERRARWMRGWSAMTHVVLVCLEHRDVEIAIRATENCDATDILGQMPARVALGSVYSVSATHSIASVGVRDDFISVPKGARTSYHGGPAERFWDFTKERLIALRKVPCKYFPLYLGESWFRFHRGETELASVLQRCLHSTAIADVRELLQSTHTRGEHTAKILADRTERGQVLSAIPS